jgi:hypothetical protein
MGGNLTDAVAYGHAWIPQSSAASVHHVARVEVSRLPDWIESGPVWNWEWVEHVI